MSHRNRSKKWCFTLNNYTQTQIDALKSKFAGGDITYLIFGKETAPTTGTPHLQGYMELEKRDRLSAVTKMFPKYHLIAARGTAEESKTYCSKEGNYEEYGTKLFTNLTYQELQTSKHYRNLSQSSTTEKTYTHATKKISNSRYKGSMDFETTLPVSLQNLEIHRQYSALLDLQELARHAPRLTTQIPITKDLYTCTANQVKNSSTDILDNQSSSSMIFEEKYLSPICSNYWTGTTD